MAVAVVLFDIDGTLIRRAGPQHRDALISSIREVTGLDTSLDGISTSGSLDRDLIALMMRNAGATEDAIRLAMPRIVCGAQRAFRRSACDLQPTVCPGVRDVLRTLHRAGCVMGLVTGNLTEIGWCKVRRARLHPWFRFGAFAEQATTRAGLARIAQQQARRAGWLRRDTPVSLIGDHANDIAAAKLNGIRAVAVATGLQDRSTLLRFRPDVLLTDLRCLRLPMLL